MQSRRLLLLPKARSAVPLRLKFGIEVADLSGMNQFEWSEKHSVGCPDVDDEHKALFRIAQELYDAIHEGTARAELTSLFDRLASYTRFHFANEEALMRKTGALDYDQHCREHRKFTLFKQTLFGTMLHVLETKAIPSIKSLLKPGAKENEKEGVA